VSYLLKAIVRGYSYLVLPITWRSRKTGTSSLHLEEQGSRYLFIVLYVWLERLLTRGDYRRAPGERFEPWEAQSRSRASA
jgi:dolichol-phosphate mannosyltransferase